MIAKDIMTKSRAEIVEAIALGKPVAIHTPVYDL